MNLSKRAPQTHGRNVFSGPVATADVLDDCPDAVVFPPLYQHFGGRLSFHGPCVLVECFEDNSKVKALLESDGRCPTTGLSQVLLVNGQGSKKCALLGDQIATKAQNNGWAGVVIAGCVRDVAILQTLALGVMAYGATPRKSVRQNKGEINPPGFQLHDFAIHPGNFVYADVDGIVIYPKPLELHVDRYALFLISFVARPQIRVVFVVLAPH